MESIVTGCHGESASNFSSVLPPRDEVAPGERSLLSRSRQTSPRLRPKSRSFRVRFLFGRRSACPRISSRVCSIHTRIEWSMEPANWPFAFFVEVGHDPSYSLNIYSGFIEYSSTARRRWERWISFFFFLREMKFWKNLANFRKVFGLDDSSSVKDMYEFYWKGAFSVSLFAKLLQTNLRTCNSTSVNPSVLY